MPRNSFGEDFTENIPAWEVEDGGSDNEDDLVEQVYYLEDIFDTEEGPVRKSRKSVSDDLSFYNS